MRAARFVLYVAAALAATAAGAQQPGEKRVALVIGNDRYLHAPSLEKAANDAVSVGAELGRLGFEVLAHTNLDRRAMNRAVGDFAEKIAAGGVGVFFFAGHGVQVSGSNFLLPVDIKVARADELPDEAIDLGRVMERLAQARAKFTLMIVDACRDNPFPRVLGRSIGGARGLTIPQAPEGLIVIYSAGINEQAVDKLSPEDRNPNGLFTREFIQHLREPGVRVDDMVKRVRDSVRSKARAAGHAQNPAIYDQSSGEFYFALAAAAPAGAEAARAASPAAANALTLELEFWNNIKDGRNPDEYRAYLEQYPQGRFAALARARLKGGEARPAPAADPVAAVFPPTATKPLPVARRPIAGMAPGATFRDCDLCPEMVVIPAGSFMMGSPDSEPERDIDEGPQHRVTIAKPFAAGKFEVTFDEWDACIGDDGCGPVASDLGWGRGRRPVNGVLWSNAKRYVEWLSKKTGANYRLLTEAEWEYVARAGTTTAFSTGPAIAPGQANFDATETYAGSVSATAQRQTVPVGSFKPNRFGLYDVHGNVWEWVEDCWNSNYQGAPADGSAWLAGTCGQRVLRGGSWTDHPRFLRSAYRIKYDFLVQLKYLFGLGLRVARSD